MSTTSASPKPPALLFLVLLAALMLGSVHIISPAMPAMALELRASVAVVQWSMTVYIATVAVGQLLYGQASDRFGRRPPLLFGLALFMVGTVVCWFAPTVTVLLLGRFIQGAGACACTVLSRAMLRDTYPAERITVAMAYFGMGMGLAPAVSPLLGGFIEVQFGWRASFGFLLAFAVVMFAVTWRQPETLRTRTEVLGIGIFFGNFARLLAMPRFAGYAALWGLQTFLFFAFAATAPVLVIGTLGIRSDVYGLYYLAIPAGYMVGNFALTRLATRYSPLRLMFWSTLGVAALAAVMAVLHLLGGLSLPALFVPMAFVCCVQGVLVPQLQAVAVGLDPKMIGAASGTLGSVQMAAGGLGTFIISLVETGSGTPLVALVAVAALAAVPAMWIGNYGLAGRRG